MLAKKIALGFGIAIVLPMLIHYGVATFFPEPKPEDYRMSPETIALRHGSPSDQAKFEEEQRRTGDALEAAEAQFQRRLFAVAVPLGLVAVIIGTFLRLPAIGTGLMFGGIVTVCDGYFNYWDHLSASFKFISLLAAFILLIFVGYRKLERKEI
jgi:hypothetical protein